MASEELMRLQAVVKTSFDPSALTGSYQPLNGSGFSDTVKILQLYNPSTTISVDLSLDGVNDHGFLPPLGTLVIDCQTNHADSPSFGTGTLNVAAGQILWGKVCAHPTYIQIVGFR